MFDWHHIRASEVCSDSLNKEVGIPLPQASGAHKRKGPGHNLRITPRATLGGLHPAVPTCSRWGLASGSRRSFPSHSELNRYLPDHGLAEFSGSTTGSSGSKGTPCIYPIIWLCRTQQVQYRLPNSASMAGTMCKKVVLCLIGFPAYGEVRP